MALYQEAPAAQPDYALGHGSLGTLLEELGDFEAARAPAFREAIRCDPDHARAHAQLATFCAASSPRRNWPTWVD